VTFASEVDPAVLAPIGFTTIGLLVILAEDALLTPGRNLLGRRVTPAYAGTLIAFTAIFALGLALYVTAVGYADGGSVSFQLAHPMFQQDRFGALMSALVIVVGALTCAMSVAYLSELGIHHGVYHALVLASVTGAIVLVGAIDLIAVYLGLELMTLPAVVLAGFDRARLRSNEAAIKFFLTSAFASAVLLYGMALTYGATGSTGFAEIRDAFDPTNPVAMLGLGFVLVGFGFKVASVPLHQWAPDVYEGAPAPVAAFTSVALTAAAFAALLRFVATAIGPETAALSNVFALLAIASMVVGNVMALIQKRVKRMLAYSGIGHVGALWVGFAAGSPQGYGAVAFYLVAYAFMTLGAYAVVVTLARDGRECEDIAEFAGLARTRPGLAAAMTLFVLALAGVPGTAGFVAKFNLIAAAVRAEMIWLPITIVTTTGISLYTCLRIPVLMMMREPAEPPPSQNPIATGEALALVGCAAVTLYLGLLPNHAWMPVLDWVSESTRHLFGS
jgi:NADH-quinone oxidoreductase subunit N